MTHDILAIDAVVNLWTTEAHAIRPQRDAFFGGKMKVKDNTLHGVSLDEKLRRMDAALWADEAAGFTPHAMAEAPAALAHRSPVLLAEQVPSDLAQQAVLINMSDQLPDDPHKRERMIELVSSDEQAIQDARERWKSYKQRGFSLVNHAVRQRTAGKAADSG